MIATGARVTVAVDETSDRARIVVDGALDATVSTTLESGVLTVVERVRVVVDLTHVTHCDEHGAAALTRIRVAARLGRADVRFVVSVPVERKLDGMGLFALVCP